MFAFTNRRCPAVPFLFAILALVAYMATALAQTTPPNNNVTLIGRWSKGECWTVAARGDTVLVANGAGVDILDWSESDRAQLLGRVELSGPIADIFLRDNVAYLAGALDGLTILDLQDFRFPQVIGTCPLLRTPADLDLDSTRVYVAVRDSGLCVIDVSNPANPQRVARVAIPGLWFLGVSAADGFAYIAADYSGGLRVFDVRDPLHPVQAGSLRVEGYLRRLAVRDTLLFGVEDPNALVIIDVADPQNPVLISRFSRHGKDIALLDSLACMAGDDEFHVIDVSDPGAPQEVGSYDFTGPRRVKHLAVSGPRAYLSDLETGVWAVDLTDPSHPEPFGLYPAPGRTEKIAIGSGFAYVAGGSRASSPRGVTVLDMRNPASPKEAGDRILSNYRILDLACARGVLFVAATNEAGEDSILCVDVRSPDSPAMVSRFGPFRATALCAQDSLLFAAGTDQFHREVLYVIDVRDPANPVKIGGRLLKISGEIWDVVAQGGYAYIARGGVGLQILDVRDPTSPKRVGLVDCTARAGGVAVHGSYAFVADRHPAGRLSVVDVSDPAAPVEKATYDVGKSCYDIAADGPFVYVAASSRGLRVLDVSDPLKPVEMGYYDTPGLAMAVATDTALVYVADGPTGVLVLRNEAQPSGVSMRRAQVPESQVLIRSYPNPFNSATRLEIRSPAAGPVRLEAYDTRGRRVRTLISGWKSSGTHNLRWDATDDTGRPLPSGVYLVRLEAGAQVAARKVVLIR